jgi:hypothetical protein
MEIQLSSWKLGDSLRSDGSLNSWAVLHRLGSLPLGIADADGLTEPEARWFPLEQFPTSP